MEGGCFCGEIRYRAEGPVSYETNCHCAICRRTSGAPYVAWFTVSNANFALTAGEPVTFRSSQHAERSFCGRCGTCLTFRSDAAPGEIDVTTASLDDPEALPPKDHTFARSRLSWVGCDEELPSFPGARS